MSSISLTRTIFSRVLMPANGRSLLLARLASTNPQSGTSVSYDADSISKIVKSDKVVVFMKGIPDAPRCGFSNAVVQVSACQAFYAAEHPHQKNPPQF